MDSESGLTPPTIMLIKLGMTTAEFESVYTAWSNSKKLDEIIANFAVLDSGAEIHVSGHRDDFNSLSSKPDVALQGIDGAISKGKPIAYRGWLRTNNLGISAGIFYPGLGNERIISTTKLVKDGWNISLGKPRSLMIHKGRNKMIELDTSGKLPRLRFKILERKPGITEAPLTSGRPPPIHKQIGEELYITKEHVDTKYAGEDEEEGDGKLKTKSGKRVTDAKLGGHNIKTLDEKPEPRRNLPKVKIDASLDLHQRLAHLTIPGMEVNCPECIISKGSRKATLNERRKMYCPGKPLEQLNCDFWGPVGKESATGSKLALVVICDVSANLWVRPIAQRSDAPAVMADLLDDINRAEATYQGQRVVQRVRCDSDTVFRGEDWKKVLNDRGIVEIYSSPYLPQQNGVAERMMLTMGNCVRSILCGVDRSLW